MEDKKTSKKKSALDAAADYLSYRMRTCAEVAKKLKDKGYDEDEIEGAIEQLKSLKYLDDYEYALRYYQYSSSKHHGARRAERELSDKGVPSETIALAYEDYIYESKVDEYEEALEIAKKEVELKGIAPDDRMIARVARKLESRGFRADDIYRVMSEMRTWRDTTEQ